MILGFGLLFWVFDCCGRLFKVRTTVSQLRHFKARTNILGFGVVWDSDDQFRVRTTLLDYSFGVRSTILGFVP